MYGGIQWYRLTVSVGEADVINRNVTQVSIANLSLNDHLPRDSLRSTNIKQYKDFC
ncbi:hypothetical protein DPMN_152740 [Dreissena polymorpha]|uniref:Uncharacterized protein n=1 Tax=Dreissena polymorpha TaxID=45954 RepID=A0A9D4FLU2_DREPO|nr:hypothetical protein DPMN_152711 [Dreissena polymorpha]KAH3799136.1 hypothetical protein DPMN_152740 [Dreissena polymorpha]